MEKSAAGIIVLRCSDSWNANPLADLQAIGIRDVVYLHQ
jgi:hypothetical protein